MICPKCGNGINENDVSCSKCGSSVKELFQQSGNLDYKSLLTVSNVDNNSSGFNILTKLKEIFVKHKKIIIPIFVVFILFVVLINSPVFERFSWDDSYLDLDTEYVTQSEVKLGVKLSNKKKIDSIKYTSSCGKVSGKGLEVVWDLSDVTGKCEITASYGLRSLKRILNVIPFDVNDELGLFYDKIDENSDDDLDFDGLTNKQEKEYKTNVEVSDTDLDGLDDYYEVFTSKTDPNKKDSDDDGLNDYDEIELELDPLKEDSKDDGIKDGERELNYNYENDKLKLSVVGKGNIASTISQVNSNTKISGKKGFIDNLYTLYMDGTLKEAILTIKYTDDELNEYGLDEDNLSIYFYDEKKSKYEKIDSKIDKENKTVTAKLKHFSNYVLGDSSLVKEEMTNEVLFILDNSWSMYTNEQYKEYTGKDFFGGYFESSTLPGSDKDGLRFSLTSDLAKKLYNKKFKIGLSEFRNDYANAVSIGSNYNGIKKKLKSMKEKFITSVEGTNIGNALKKGIDEFSDDADNKYVVILTDGEDSSLSSNTNNIIEKAMGNSVKICSIGFGDGSSNSELSAISYGTGCKFYSAGDAMGLTELFDNIGTELDDDLVDVNDDGNLDGLLTADSGFIVNRDGFSFKNYGSNFSKGGHCYGMATFAQLYYKKVLPTKLGTKKVGKNTSYSYNFSNTYFNNYSDLYNYKLKTNALKYNFGFDTFGEKMPEDFRKLDGDTLVLNEKYKKEMIDSKFYDITVEKSQLDKKSQLKKWGVSYSKAESFQLNENSMQKNSVIDNNDLQMFNAIYASFIKQNAQKHYSSSSDLIMWLRNVIGTESSESINSAGFINILKARLDDKDAPVLFSDFGNGLHAINAISLVQDAENPNFYSIGVYDNNYPGYKRYLRIECNKDICVSRSNGYYSNSGQPIRITPSLEYDLSYFK